MKVRTPFSVFSKFRKLIKQLQILAWFETFEKLFSFGVKLIWIGLFVAFGIYLRKEYKKDVYYLQDFKVPNAWSEQGYTGDVVKESINDEIDKITTSVYKNDRSVKGFYEDNTQILSDLNFEGFNLKAVTKSILSVLGKKHKTIGGYAIIDDSTQTISVQVTDQMTQELSIKRKEPVRKLLKNAALEIMKVKMPVMLLSYYYIQNDTSSAAKVFKYLRKNRHLISNYDFYDIAIRVAITEKNYENAFTWSDSMFVSFPNDKMSFLDRAIIYGAVYGTSTLNEKQKTLYFDKYIENLKKTVEPERTLESDDFSDAQIYDYLARTYYSKKNFNAALENYKKISEIRPLSSSQNNLLAYCYIGKKDYKNAEIALKKALFKAPDNGDYIDSYAELCSLQGKDSLAVAYLIKALKAPEKSGSVSFEAYKKDPRWVRLQKRKDFQAMMNTFEKGSIPPAAPNIR